VDVTYQGWSRNHGEKTIFDSSILEMKNLFANTPRMECFSGVGFRINSYAKLSLNGEYQINIYLSKSEIDLMFALVNESAVFSEISKKISALYDERDKLNLKHQKYSEEEYE